MARGNDWANKVLALLKAGNSAAAIAQIKVAPGVKDLKALQLALATSPMAARLPQVTQAVEDNLALLSAPRLHRSP